MDGRNSAEPAGFPADNLWYLSRGVSLARLLRSVLADTLPEKMRIVDIGAGYGHTIFALRAVMVNQIEATAVEPDPRCHQTLARVADHVIATDITGPVSPESLDGGFHVALLLHVVEHMPDPLAFLKLATKMLKPGGLLVLEVPNCPMTRVRWYNLETPHVPHLIFFTAAGLESLLKRADLELLLLDSFGPVFDFTGSYDSSFVRSPVGPSDNIRQGIAPPIPYPIFAESGPDRLFLRAIARLDAGSKDGFGPG
jgi:SAM-dependent methyltransferase